MRRWLFLFILPLLFSACQQNGSQEMFERAMRLWQEQKHEEAVQNFVALTTAYPDDDLVDDALFWVGNLYEHYLGNPDQAVRFYRTLSKNFDSSPYHHQSMTGLARVYSDQGDDGRQKALLIYQKLQQSKLKPKDYEINQIRLSRLFIEARQYSKARIELKRLIQTTKSQAILPKAYHLIGQSYYMEGRLDLAEIAYLEIDRRFDFGRPTLASAMSLAQLYEEMDQLQSAISIYESIIHRLEQREVFYQLASDRIIKLKSRQRQTSKS